jgi:hypothetical protein
LEDAICNLVGAISKRAKAISNWELRTKIEEAIVFFFFPVVMLKEHKKSSCSCLDVQLLKVMLGLG